MYMLNPMGSCTIVSLLILTLLATYSKGQLKPYICSQCATQFADFGAYERHFDFEGVPSDHHKHDYNDFYWARDPMKHMHLWHAQHSASSSFSSKHHHQQQHHDVPTLFFNPPTPAQRELYFKTFGAVVENEENKRDDWHFEFSQWGTTHFKPYPDPDKRNEYYIPDPKQIHKIKGDGHCLFRAISYAMMGTEAFYYPIRANNERFLDSVNTNRVVEHGEYTDIINTAVFYKVNIIIYYAKEDRTKAGSGYILGQNLKMRWGKKQVTIRHIQPSPLSSSTTTTTT